MRRREFITLLGGAPVWPIAAHPQPAMPVVGFLHSASAAAFADFVAAFRKGLMEVGVVTASTNSDIDQAFATLLKKRTDAFLISPEALFVTRRVQLVSLAARHALPALYHRREFTDAGGLMSYGSDLTDQFRRAGIYAGRILKGEKPAEMPVQLPTKFEFVVNLQAAKTLGLEVPPTLLARADEVIE
jgi:putative ABC transport system substrate-binding protein